MGRAGDRRPPRPLQGNERQRRLPQRHLRQSARLQDQGGRPDGLRDRPGIHRSRRRRRRRRARPLPQRPLPRRHHRAQERRHRSRPRQDQRSHARPAGVGLPQRPPRLPLGHRLQLLHHPPLPPQQDPARLRGVHAPATPRSGDLQPVLRPAQTPLPPARRPRTQATHHRAPGEDRRAAEAGRRLALQFVS